MEAVTIIECPPITIIGVVGYIETPRGLRALKTVWAGHISTTALRRFYKNWYHGKKKAFTKYAKNIASEAGQKNMENQLAKISKYATIVRVIAHTDMTKLNLRQKKAHIMEIQINGGSVADKVKYAKDLFEQSVRVDKVFSEYEKIDIIGVTKGKGFQGVVKRFGVRRLPRKTHRGLRKVACIGPWHPMRVNIAVARAGQLGYFHRTELSKEIYRVGKFEENDKNASTEVDLTVKGINPLGGFPRYGIIKNDWLMIKGCCIGCKKRILTLRKSLHPYIERSAEALEDIHKNQLQFIDTSSKFGHGRFQTVAEKRQFYNRKEETKAEA